MLSRRMESLPTSQDVTDTKYQLLDNLLPRHETSLS